MEKFRHVSLVFIICLVIGIQGISANDTGTRSFPHLNIVLFKFGGIEDSNIASYAEFTGAIRMAVIRLYGKFVYYGQGLKYLSDLDYIEFENRETPTNSKRIEDFYKNIRALKIHIGNVGSKTNDSEKIIVYVRDNIFLINSEAKVRTIELVHNIIAEEYYFLKNIQQAIICYALAMDAKRMKKEDAIVINLLSESKMMMEDSFKMVSNIDSGNLSIAKLLEKVIKNELNELDPSSQNSGPN